MEDIHTFKDDPTVIYLAILTDVYRKRLKSLL